MDWGFFHYSTSDTTNSLLTFGASRTCSPKHSAAVDGESESWYGECVYPVSRKFQYRGNSAATSSLVLGIIGLVTSLFICPSIVLVILSFVFGIIGLVNVKNGKGTIAGKGKSIAGISCSVAGLIVIALMFKSVKDAHLQLVRQN